jgi:hypothetical protein
MFTDQNIYYNMGSGSCLVIFARAFLKILSVLAPFQIM